MTTINNGPTLSEEVLGMYVMTHWFFSVENYIQSI